MTCFKDNRIKRIIRILTVLVFLCVNLTWPVSAGQEYSNGLSFDLIGHSDNYSAVLYDDNNGLPTASTTDIAQTEDGFIWIASYAGLIRYDGNTFERMDSTHGITTVSCLFVDSSDRLWVGTNDNGIVVMEGGGSITLDVKDGLCSSKICDIKEDNDGNIFVGTSEGINVIRSGMKVSKVDDARIKGAYIERMHPGKDGLMYCITSEDDYFTLRNTELVDYIGREYTSVESITCILPDPDEPGKLFVGNEDSVLYHCDPKKKEVTAYADISPLSNVIDVQQFGDQLWVCARNGIGVVDHNGFHLLDNLPMNNSINHVMEDYEGNLWFTSSRQGVMKITANRFSDMFVRYGLEPEVVNTTCMFEDKLYVGTDNGLIVIGDNRPLSSVPLSSAQTASGESIDSSDLLQMLKGSRVRMIISDSKGRLWISTWRAIGLVCYDHGNVTVFTKDEGLMSNQIRGIAEDRNGSIYVACTGGMNEIRDGKVVRSIGDKDGIANAESLTVAVAPNGDILLGSNGDGLYIIDGDNIRNVGKSDSLTSGVIMKIKYDTENKVFWLVTGNSLAYMTEDYKVTTIEEFPYPDNLDLYKNSKGDMWILSSDGIYVIPAKDLIANGEINPVHYGKANGIPCITTSNSFSELTKDGNLYISGRMGVIKVNIEQALEDVNDLKQCVPFVDADDKRIYPLDDGSFSIPSDAHKLIVYPEVFNYSLTDPKVSYCLNGFDSEYTTVSRSDLGPITYTNLPGGTYHFDMELKDALGRKTSSVSVKIVKEKYIYEETWFSVLGGLFGALIIIGMTRLYVRGKMLDMEVKHREEAERERVNNELHMAKQIQFSSLPHDFPPFPDRKEFDIYASMDPAREVGGDFYDFFLLDDDHLCLVIADVSGKGIPAAMFMMISMVTIHSTAAGRRSAAEILKRVNEELCSNNQMEMFVTVWLGILEISSGELVAANAGHEYPAIKRSDGRFELFRDKHGFVIGGMAGMNYTDYELLLEPGDKLFVYTDGLTEAEDAEHNMFGTQRMLETLNSEPDAAPEKMLQNVKNAVAVFVNEAEQFDDLTMLGFEYNGSVEIAEPANEEDIEQIPLEEA